MTKSLSHDPEANDVTTPKWMAVLTLATASFACTAVPANGEELRRTADPAYTFGRLKPLASADAKRLAEEWLRSSGRADQAALARFHVTWVDDSRGVLERVIETFTAFDAEAAQLLSLARDPEAPAPQQIPELFHRTDRPAFYRANLAVAYARALTGRRVFEEALAALATVTPEQTADPAAYLFHRAVAEHGLMLKDPAQTSVMRLLDDVADAPDRYKMVGTLLYFDTRNWKSDPKDLDNISRLMHNSFRRLDLSRAGPKTQGIQKKIVFRLDELIKDLENKANQSSQCNGGSCPNGGQKQAGPGSANPSMPMQDSQIATNGGAGIVDEKKLRNLAELWGKLPEKDRAQTMQNFTRGLPPRHREIIEKYFKTLADRTKS